MPKNVENYSDEEEHDVSSIEPTDSKTHAGGESETTQAANDQNKLAMTEATHDEERRSAFDKGEKDTNQSLHAGADQTTPTTFRERRAAAPSEEDPEDILSNSEGPQPRHGAIAMPGLGVSRSLNSNSHISASAEEMIVAEAVEQSELLVAEPEKNALVAMCHAVKNNKRRFCLSLLCALLLVAITFIVGFNAYLLMIVNFVVCFFLVFFCIGLCVLKHREQPATHDN